jgi:Domain of unknown function (DUF222)
VDRTPDNQPDHDGTPVDGSESGAPAAEPPTGGPHSADGAAVGSVAGVRPGPVLAALLDLGERADVGDHELIERIKGWRRQESWAAAGLLHDLMEFARRRPDDPTLERDTGSELIVDEFAHHEIALALTLAPGTAKRHLEQAVDVSERVPNALDSLARGDIDFPHLDAIHDVTSPLSAQDAAELAQQMLDEMTSHPLTTGQLKARLRRKVLARRSREENEADEREAATKKRGVQLRDQSDGTSELRACLSSREGATAWAIINSAAQQAKTTGDTRPVDQRRADAFFDLLIGRLRRAYSDAPAAPDSPTSDSPTPGSPTSDSRTPDFPSAGSPIPGFSAPGSPDAQEPGRDAAGDHRSPDRGSQGNHDGAHQNGNPSKNDSAHPNRNAHAETRNAHAETSTDTYHGTDSSPSEHDPHGPAVADRATAAMTEVAKTIVNVTISYPEFLRIADHLGLRLLSGATGGSPSSDTGTGPSSRSSAPGTIDSLGAVPGWVVRDLVTDVITRPGTGFRAVIYDPVTGELKGLSSIRYVPFRAMSEHIRHRDVTCRFPGCRRAARRCDVDHVRAWARGGVTEICNLECLCRQHHRLKQNPAWAVRHEGGIARWTAPTGHTYDSWPYDYRDPEPPHDAEPPPDLDWPDDREPPEDDAPLTATETRPKP